MKNHPFVLSVLTLLVPAPAVMAATFAISSLTTLVTPSTRGNAGTTYYGWDTFSGNPGDAGFPNLTAPINDSTPELGTNPGLALLVTNNGEDHISSSQNYYSASGSVNETVTFDTSGTAGTGVTTLILQGITAFGDFGAPITFSSINGVAPVVVFGVNAAAKGQFWVRWDVPGNQDTYTATLTSGANSNNSFDILSVDTYWNSGTTYQPDLVVVPEPSSALLLGVVGLMIRRRRR